MQSLYQDTAREGGSQQGLQLVTTELEEARGQLDATEGSMERCRQVLALAKRMAAAPPPPAPVLL